MNENIKIDLSLDHNEFKEAYGRAKIISILTLGWDVN